MEPLRTYLRETRTTPKAFAKMIGVDAGQFDRMLAGDLRISLSVAQRMVDATGGALITEELLDQDDGGAPVHDLRGLLAADGAEIDVDALTRILAGVLPELLGGMRRKGDDQLPALAAEAAAHTYVALSTVTSRRGAARLFQALRPVFAEILEEFAAPQAAHARLDGVIEAAVALYFQARREGRPA